MSRGWDLRLIAVWLGCVFGCLAVWGLVIWLVWTLAT